MKKNEFEIIILPNGDIQYCRYDDEINKSMLHLLSKLNKTSNEESKKFLRDSCIIENILGNKNLCG